MKHLTQLINLGLVSEEIGDNERVFKLTDKGRVFILEFVKVEKFAEAFGIAI
jgi:predicted transcriptional regulator